MWHFSLSIFANLQLMYPRSLNTFNSLLINKAFGFSVLDSQLLGIALAGFQGMLYVIFA